MNNQRQAAKSQKPSQRSKGWLAALEFWPGWWYLHLPLIVAVTMMNVWRYAKEAVPAGYFLARHPDLTLAKSIVSSYPTMLSIIGVLGILTEITVWWRSADLFKVLLKAHAQYEQTKNYDEINAGNSVTPILIKLQSYLHSNAKLGRGHLASFSRAFWMYGIIPSFCSTSSLQFWMFDDSPIAYWTCTWITLSFFCLVLGCAAIMLLYTLFLPSSNYTQDRTFPRLLNYLSNK